MLLLLMLFAGDSEGSESSVAVEASMGTGLPLPLLELPLLLRGLNSSLTGDGFTERKNAFCSDAPSLRLR